MRNLDKMIREKQCTIATGLDTITNVRNEDDGGRKSMSEKQVKQDQAGYDLEVKQVEELVQPGRFGVTNKQMIPAIKKAIAEGNVEKLILFKRHYQYTFNKSLKYLKKNEKEYITGKLS